MAASTQNTVEFITCIGKIIGLLLVVAAWLVDREWLKSKFRKEKKEMVKQMEEMTDATARIHKKLSEK